VAYPYNPSYAGGRDPEANSLGKQFMTPCLEKKSSQKGLVEWLKA
jgi:hypothetical protein